MSLLLICRSTSLYTFEIGSVVKGCCYSLTYFNHATFRVCTGAGKPGKSWNFVVAFSESMTGKSWKKASGPGKFCSRSPLGKSMLGRPLHPVTLNNRLCNELLLPPRTTIIWWALCNKHSSWVGMLNNEDARVRIYKTLSWRVTRYPVPFSLSWNRSFTRFNTNSTLCRRLLFKEPISSRPRANYE